MPSQPQQKKTEQKESTPKSNIVPKDNTSTNEHNTTSETNQDEEVKECKKPKGKDAEKKIKWTDVGMFITNVILAAGTLLLFREATTQRTESDIKFSEENRPYADISNIEVDTNALENGALRLIYIMTNVGKFPTKVISIKEHAAIGTDTLKPVISSSVIETAKNAFLASDKINQTVNTIGGIITPYRLQNIMNGTFAIFIFYDIDYESDAFHKIYSEHIVYSYKFACCGGISLDVINRTSTERSEEKSN